ncbi:MAG: hypothetical protein ACLQMF_02500 [Rectinemataceae bacterium]
MYRIRRATLAVLTAASLAGSAFVYCQSAAGPSSTSPTGAEAVFAPFPSHISAEPLAGGIKLRWIDSPDVAGSYAIYRSATPVTASNVDSATRLATVARGTQSYTDRPPDSKPYYYLILALAADGTPYRIVIPARNSTMAAVRAPAPEPSAASAPATVGTPVSTTPLPAIDGLKATAKGDAILLSYRPAVAGIRLVVYRGTAPITESADLLDAALIATFKDKNGSFADYPVPGLDYWYAVLGEDNLKAGHIELRQGHDVTSQPIRIAAPSSNEGTVAEGPSPRTRPLPILVLNRAPEEGAAPLPPSVLPPTRVALAPETEKAVAFLLGSEPESRPSMPVLKILSEELGNPSGGEDYALSLIVSGKLDASDWKGAVDELDKYLSLNRSHAVGARAHFYLGEALANTGAFRDAFFELLTARQDYPAETKPWIDYVLFNLRNG